jgi:uncharacterized protein YdhG (YjbR/CyaY superfamily)
MRVAWLDGVASVDGAGARRTIRLGSGPMWVWTPTLRETGVMSSDEIDSYLAGLDEPKRATLERLRTSIMAVVPDADQCISYGAPAFKVRGKAVAGFAAFHSHLSYLPHSGSVLDELRDDVAGYETSKGSLRFAIDDPLPDGLVQQLITARLRELGAA